MFDVHVSGLGAKLTTGQATSAGRPVALVRTADGLVPSHALAQGEAVQVTATATPPSWLRWLVGGRVTATKTLKTPAATTTASVALASLPGVVPVRFDHPVSVVDYRAGGGPPQVLRLDRPATTAELAVPSQAAAGSLQVAAAPLPWETVASHASALTWFVAPAGAGPVALADPAPETATAAPNAPIKLTFAQPVATVLGANRPAVSPAVPGTWTEPGRQHLDVHPERLRFRSWRGGDRLLRPAGFRRRRQSVESPHCGQHRLPLQRRPGVPGTSGADPRPTRTTCPYSSSLRPA